MELNRTAWTYIFTALFALLAFQNIVQLRSATKRGSHSVSAIRWRAIVTIGAGLCAVLNLIWASTE